MSSEECRSRAELLSFLFQLVRNTGCETRDIDVSNFSLRILSRCFFFSLSLSLSLFFARRPRATIKFRRFCIAPARNDSFRCCPVLMNACTMELFDGDYRSSGQTYRKAKRMQQGYDADGDARAPPLALAFHSSPTVRRLV